MATWTDPVILISPTLSSNLVQLAGNTRFGDLYNNVMGLVVSLGGNGSNRVVQQKKTYYWHL